MLTRDSFTTRSVEAKYLLTPKTDGCGHTNIRRATTDRTPGSSAPHLSANFETGNENGMEEGEGGKEEVGIRRRSRRQS